MFYQIFLSLLTERSAIISNKHALYEFRQEFPNNLRLKVLGS